MEDALEVALPVGPPEPSELVARIMVRKKVVVPSGPMPRYLRVDFPWCMQRWRDGVQSRFHEICGEVRLHLAAIYLLSVMQVPVLLKPLCEPTSDRLCF